MLPYFYDMLSPIELEKIRRYEEYMRIQKLKYFEEEKKEGFFERLKRWLCCKKRQIDLS